MEKMRIAIIGCGLFAKCFVPLFKAHPVVEKVAVCDLISERAENYSKMFDVEITESFEKVLEGNEFNAVAIFPKCSKLITVRDPLTISLIVDSRTPANSASFF